MNKLQSQMKIKLKLKDIFKLCSLALLDKG